MIIISVKVFIAKILSLVSSIKRIIAPYDMLLIYSQLHTKKCFFAQENTRSLFRPLLLGLNVLAGSARPWLRDVPVRCALKNNRCGLNYIYQFLSFPEAFVPFMAGNTSLKDLFW